MVIAVPVQAHPETVFVFLSDIGWRHADEAIARVVVGGNQTLDNIYLLHGAEVRQLCPYPGFDGSVELLHNGRLLLALIGQVLNTLAFHEGMEV